MGLVYGLIFAFMFQRAATRVDELADAVGEECGYLIRLLLLLRSMATDSHKHLRLTAESKHAAYDADRNGVFDVHDVLARLVGYGRQIEYEITVDVAFDESVESISELYLAGDMMRELCVAAGAGTGEGSPLDRFLDTIACAGNARYRRWSLMRRKIRPVTWVFLVLLSGMMFYGALLVESGWPVERLFAQHTSRTSNAPLHVTAMAWDLTVAQCGAPRIVFFDRPWLDRNLCLLTVASIGLCLFILGDMNYTATGFVTVDRAPLVQLQAAEHVVSDNLAAAAAATTTPAAAAAAEAQAECGGAESDRF